MAFYLVRARPKPGTLDELQARLDDDAFVDMEPFGTALTRALEHARFDEETGEAVWEEEDYCNPPLKQERDAVLEDYFTDFRVKRVEKDAGWDEIQALPRLWDAAP